MAHERVRRLQTSAASDPAIRAAGPGSPENPPSDGTGFHACAACHPTDTSGRPGVGPNLRDVLGRQAGSDPDFAYSQALRERRTPWTETELDTFLADPAAYAPGTKMPFAGLPDAEGRAAIIRFLRDLD